MPILFACNYGGKHRAGCLFVSEEEFGGLVNCFIPETQFVRDVTRTGFSHSTVPLFTFMRYYRHMFSTA